MQFKYPLTPAGKNGVDKVPMVDVRIINSENGKAVNYRAMIDSGAFMNIFHSDIAEVLGIDLDSAKDELVFTGVKKAKQMKGKGYALELMLLCNGKSHKFNSYVLFSDEIQGDGYGLLGRMGFFDHFDEVALNYKDKCIYVRKEKLST